MAPEDSAVLPVAPAEARSVAQFFVLSFALAWTLWFAGSAIASVADGGFAQIAFLPGTFAPALVALWLAARSRRPEHLRELKRGLTLWRVPLRWYVFALTFMAAVKLSAALLHRFTTGVWPPFGDVPVHLMLLATVFSTPFQAGEEIGWRGYSLPRLASLVGFPTAGVLLGAIWALWHLPLFVLPHADMVAQPFVVFLLAVTAASVAMTWLYARTQGSLLLPMVMHAAINNTTGIVPSAERTPPGLFATNASLIAWYTVLVLWLAAGYFLTQLRTGGEFHQR